jgi:hypothetical protein
VIFNGAFKRMCAGTVSLINWSIEFTPMVCNMCETSSWRGPLWRSLKLVDDIHFVFRSANIGNAFLHKSQDFCHRVVLLNFYV